MGRQPQGGLPFGLDCEWASITDLIFVGPQVAFRPRPGAISQSACKPWVLNRSRHKRTVLRFTRFSAAIAISGLPAAQARTMRQRSATCCGVPKAANHCSSCLSCYSDKTSVNVNRGMSDYPECPHNMSSYLLDTTLAVCRNENFGYLQSITYGANSYGDGP